MCLTAQRAGTPSDSDPPPAGCRYFVDAGDDMIGQTLPRTHRCDANIGMDAAAFGFTHVICQQVVGTRTYITTSGLRVAYCAIDQHEANVRRRFTERVEMPDESEAERSAEMWQRMSPP